MTPIVKEVETTPLPPDPAEVASPLRWWEQLFEPNCDASDGEVPIDLRELADAEEAKAGIVLPAGRYLFEVVGVEQAFSVSNHPTLRVTVRVIINVEVADQIPSQADTTLTKSYSLRSERGPMGRLKSLLAAVAAPRSFGPDDLIGRQFEGRIQLRELPNLDGGKPSLISDLCAERAGVLTEVDPAVAQVPGPGLDRRVCGFERDEYIELLRWWIDCRAPIIPCRATVSGDGKASKPPAMHRDWREIAWDGTGRLVFDDEIAAGRLGGYNLGVVCGTAWGPFQETPSERSHRTYLDRNERHVRRRNPKWTGPPPQLVLLVLDIEAHAVPLAQAMGLLDQGVVANSGRGGAHVYIKFALPDDYPDWAPLLLHDGTAWVHAGEIKFRNSYVVCAPSALRLPDGKVLPYTWRRAPWDYPATVLPRHLEKLIQWPDTSEAAAEATRTAMDRSGGWCGAGVRREVHRTPPPWPTTSSWPGWELTTDVDVLIQRMRQHCIEPAQRAHAGGSLPRVAMLYVVMIEALHVGAADQGTLWGLIEKLSGHPGGLRDVVHAEPDVFRRTLINALAEVYRDREEAMEVILAYDGKVARTNLPATSDADAYSIRLTWLNKNQSCKVHVPCTRPSGVTCRGDLDQMSRSLGVDLAEVEKATGCGGWVPPRAGTRLRIIRNANKKLIRTLPAGPDTTTTTTTDLSMAEGESEEEPEIQIEREPGGWWRITLPALAGELCATGAQTSTTTGSAARSGQRTVLADLPRTEDT